MGDYNDAMMRNSAAVQARTKAQNRANVLQLKLIGQSHPTGLTANLLKLFEPRAPLEYKPPIEKRKCPQYSGMAQFVRHFAEPGDPEYAPPVEKGETPAQRRARIHKLQLEKGTKKAAEELEKYDPHKDPNITGDPYKTLFVARLNYETTEHRIKREFEAYGPIKRVRLVTDRATNKIRGYAFVEYTHTRDMKTAYKQADGRKVDNKRVLVDVERGRTVPNWRPRRLGGGLGTTRIGGEELNQKYSGREHQQVASGRPRSEEPRSRVDRRDSEKSRERGRARERERERSLERSYDKTRDHDSREERHHHRDWERNKDRDRERNRGRDRDRDRANDRDRERDCGRDYDRDREREHDRDRPHDRKQERERDRDYDHASYVRDRGHTHDRDAYDYFEPKHDRELLGMKARDFDHGESNHGREWYGGPKHGQENDYYQYEQERNQERYDHQEHHGLEDSQHDLECSRRREHEYYNHVPYDKVDLVNYHSQFNHAGSESHEEGEAFGDQNYEYHRSERSLSREYEN